MADAVSREDAARFALTVLYERGVDPARMPPKPPLFDHGDVEIATRAPEFALPGIDGREHTLAEYADADALVLIHLDAICPFVRAWESEIKAIHADYSGRNVALVAINSTAAGATRWDSLDGMADRAASQGFEFAYLRDEDQSLARALGSTTTPEVFVFDRERALAYHGCINDHHDATKATEHYLRDALDALLGGHTPPVPSTPPLGCMMKWQFQTPGEIDLSPMRDAIDGAAAAGFPIALSYTSADGLPELTYETSTQVLGNDRLAIWAPDPDGDLPSAIASHPHVTLVYMNRTAYMNLQPHPYYMFRGRARIDVSVDDAVYANLPYADATHDPEQRGVAVVIEVDTVRGSWDFQGLGRSGPPQMARPAE